MIASPLLSSYLSRTCLIVPSITCICTSVFACNCLSDAYCGPVVLVAPIFVPNKGVRPSPATDTVSEYDSVLSFSVSESKEGQEEVGLALQECSCPWLASLAALRSETDCSHENELICDDTCPRGAVGVACFARDPEWLPSASAPLLPPSTELVTAVTEATESFVSLMTVYNNLLRRVHESEAVKRGACRTIQFHARVCQLAI